MQVRVFVKPYSKVSSKKRDIFTKRITENAESAIASIIKTLLKVKLALLTRAFRLNLALIVNDLALIGKCQLCSLLFPISQIGPPPPNEEINFEILAPNCLFALKHKARNFFETSKTKFQDFRQQLTANKSQNFKFGKAELKRYKIHFAIDRNTSQKTFCGQNSFSNSLILSGFERKSSRFGNLPLTGGERQSKVSVESSFLFLYGLSERENRD